MRLPLLEDSSEMVEAEGERTCEGRGDVDLGAVDGAAGERFLPLPRMRPPPMVRRDIMGRTSAHMEAE